MCICSWISTHNILLKPTLKEGHFMKIAWFCVPAHGHTNPTLGLVKTLTGSGHQVWYFSFEKFLEQIAGI